MFIVRKKVYFCAAHRLHSPHLSNKKNKETYGKCNSPNFHGHNYEVEVEVKGEIDPKTGMVINFKELGDLIENEIIEKWDHKNLNIDVEDLNDIIPTAENIAKKIWEILERKLTQGKLHSITVGEKESNIVTYLGENRKE